MKRKTKIALGLIIGDGLMIGTGVLLVYIRNLRQQIKNLDQANTYSKNFKHVHNVNKNQRQPKHSTAHTMASNASHINQSQANISDSEINKFSQLDSFAQSAEQQVSANNKSQQINKSKQSLINKKNNQSKSTNFAKETLDIIYHGVKGHRKYFKNSRLVTSLGNLYRNKAWDIIQAIDDNSTTTYTKHLDKLLKNAKSSKQYNQILEKAYNSLNLNQASYPLQKLNNLYSKCINSEANNVYSYYNANDLTKFDNIETNGTISPHIQDITLDKYNDKIKHHPMTINDYQAKSQASYERGKRGVINQLDTMFSVENEKAHKAMAKDSPQMSEHSVDTPAMHRAINHLISTYTKHSPSSSESNESQHTK